MWPAIFCFGAAASSCGGGCRPRGLDDAIRCCSAVHGGGARLGAWPRRCGCSAVTFVGVSSMMGSINYMTTIINMRAPGMTLFRMPLTIWAMFITAILQAFALPVLTAAGFMLVVDRMLGHVLLHPVGRGRRTTPLRRSAAVSRCCGSTCSGSTRTRRCTSCCCRRWAWSSDMLACMCRKPIFGYKPMVYSMAAIAGLGFIVWGHHMFTSRHEPRAGHDVHGLDDDDRAAVGGQDVQLDRHDVGRPAAVQHGDAELHRVRVDVHRRRAVAASSWRPCRSTSTSTTPTSSWPTSTTCCSGRRCSACSGRSTSGSRRCSAG